MLKLLKLFLGTKLFKLLNLNRSLYYFTKYIINLRFICGYNIHRVNSSSSTSSNLENPSPLVTYGGLFLRFIMYFSLDLEGLPCLILFAA